jgi:hypothetical protein
MDADEITNRLLYRDRETFRLRDFSQPTPQASMSPSAEEGSQTPDSKSPSGFASVFKNLTGSRPSKSPNNPPSPVAIAPVNDGGSLLPATYGGPANYEDLYAQLKKGNPLEDRIAAAKALRQAVVDYPLSGV